MFNPPSKPNSILSEFNLSPKTREINTCDFTDVDATVNRKRKSNIFMKQELIIPIVMCQYIGSLTEFASPM